jgi:hypothetical protein
MINWSGSVSLTCRTAGCLVIPKVLKIPNRRATQDESFRQGPTLDLSTVVIRAAAASLTVPAGWDSVRMTAVESDRVSWG